MAYEGLCSPTSDWTWAVKEPSLDHWTSGEFPRFSSSLFFFFLKWSNLCPFARGILVPTCLGTRDWTHAPDSKHSLNTGLPAKSLVILSSAITAEWADAQSFVCNSRTPDPHAQKNISIWRFHCYHSFTLSLSRILFLAPQISLPLRLPASVCALTVFTVTQSQKLSYSWLLFLLLHAVSC